MTPISKMKPRINFLGLLILSKLWRRNRSVFTSPFCRKSRWNILFTWRIHVADSPTNVKSNLIYSRLFFFCCEFTRKHLTAKFEILKKTKLFSRSLINFRPALPGSDGELTNQLDWYVVLQVSQPPFPRKLCKIKMLPPPLGLFENEKTDRAEERYANFLINMQMVWSKFILPRP